MWAVLIPSLGLAGSQPQAEKSIDQSRQLIVVTTESWSDNHGTLRYSSAWRSGLTPRFARATGELGETARLGIGLHQHAPTKREGDGRSPAASSRWSGLWARCAVE
jgi:hypothetical protein